MSYKYDRLKTKMLYKLVEIRHRPQALVARSSLGNFTFAKRKQIGYIDAVLERKTSDGDKSEKEVGHMCFSFNCASLMQLLCKCFGYCG